jgi:hypothetical protein
MTARSRASKQIASYAIRHIRATRCRTISDLEEYCTGLPKEQQYEVLGVIERLKSALRDDTHVMGSQHDW